MQGSARGPDRRVTFGRVLSLLLQVLLAWFTAQRIRGALSGSAWAELHAMGAVFSMIAMALLGLWGLDGMVKAALGSIPYRVAFGLTAGVLCLGSVAIVLLALVLALSLIPGAFRLPGAISRGLSLAAGLTTILTLGSGVVFFAAYGYVCGVISLLMLFRSDAKVLNHGLFRGLDRPSSGAWDVSADAFPYDPDPPRKA